MIGWATNFVPALPGGPPVLGVSWTVGPVQFDAAEWLVLVPVLGAAAWWMGRRSLAGLGSVTRWVALAVRWLVIGLLAAALAEPQWRKVSDSVNVTAVLDLSQSVSGGTQESMDRYLESAIAQGKKREQDQTGVITVAKEALVQALPSRLTTMVEREHAGTLDQSNLASAVRLAMAVAPTDASNRIVLLTDGNETLGSLLQAAEAAKAAKIPIDFVPLKYRYDGEVIVDRVVVPATARSGDNLAIKVVLTATKAAKGRLSVLMNGEVVDLDPGSSATGVPVELEPGTNVRTVTLATRRDGAQKFEAVFEPEVSGGRGVGDAIAENNRATGVSFVVGEAKVMVVAETTEDSEHIVRVLRESKIRAELVTADAMPGELSELASFDGVILINEPADRFSLQQQETLKQYVYNSGGGLVMIGGPNSFGAGGWIGSPVEDALPIRLDPPQKRQMPRGALAMVMHSVEIPQGVYYGKKVCESAVNALSRLDLVGIIEFNWQNGSDWAHPIAPVGDGSAVKKSIQNLVFGDMPDFGPIMQATYTGLMKADAGQRHCIVISDGDPQPPSQALLKKFRDAKISISTVGIACHGASDQNTMKMMAQVTGGKFYDIPGDQVGKLPQIFIKEAQTVKRSLIWEGPAFSPTVTGAAIAETFRGIGSVPAITGYVVAADRDGLSMVTLRGKENDPVMAQWSYGLGKSVTFTGEANTRWSSAWVSWASFKQFWEQHIRWAMRPAGSPNIRVATEVKGEQTEMVVEALDSKGERLNFANFQGRVTGPDGKSVEVTLKQVGPGRYEGTVPTAAAGAHVASFVYTAPGTKEGEVARGSVQAAIVKPFADEFRALEDNEPLLRQVAAATGGRVLTGDPAQDNLWSAEGLTKPVSTTPIWLVAALSAIGLFVIDVGVRRVRVEPRAIVAAVQRALSTRGKKAGEQMGSLREARAKAQRRIAERADARGVGGEAGRAGPVDVPRDTRNVKFEATPAQQRQASLNLEKPAAPARPGTVGTTGGTDKKDQPGDMSRLLKAKRKAQDEMREEP